MVDQVLAKKAVLETLEAKIKDLRRKNELKDGVTIELEFWADLATKFSFFKQATDHEVARAIYKAIEIDDRFELESVTPSIKYQLDKYSVPSVHEHGAPIVDDATQFFWHVRYFEKPKTEAHSNQAHIVVSDTPEGANWSSLQLRFIDGRTLLASIRNEGWNKSIGASEFGLEKKIGQRPKKQWGLLEEAARNNGRIVLIDRSGTDKESKRRQINGLENLLTETFPNLKGTPFEPKGGDAYQATFEIQQEQRWEDER